MRVYLIKLFYNMVNNDDQRQNIFRLYLTLLLYRQGPCRPAEERILHRGQMGKLRASPGDAARGNAAFRKI